MTKVKWSVASKKRRKKVLKQAKGQYLGRKRIRQAKESVQKGMYYAFRDRKGKKRIYRRLWITRVNAACKEMGISYSKFIAALKKAKIALDRKALAYLATNDKKGFQEIVNAVKG